MNNNNNKLQAIMAFTIKNYPYPYDLTGVRLMQLVYLIDLKNQERYNKHMITVNWDFDEYGVFSSEVFDEIKRGVVISLVRNISNLNIPRYMAELVGDPTDLIKTELTKLECRIIKQVIHETKYKTQIELLKYVSDVRID